MIAIPTTTVTILAGSTSSEWGDPEEGETVVRAGVPAAIHEQTVMSQTENDQAQIVKRAFTGRLPHWARQYVSGASRLRDDRTGDIFLVDVVSRPRNAVVPMDVRLDLRIVD